MFWLPRSILLTSQRVYLRHNGDLARAKINGKFHLSFCGLTFEQNSRKIKQSVCILMIWAFTVKYAHISDFAKQTELKGETIACCIHCLVCHPQHIDELRRAFLATNGWSAFIESLHDCAKYDRSTNFVELEVNVPRTIGILRDGWHKNYGDGYNYYQKLLLQLLS